MTEALTIKVGTCNLPDKDRSWWLPRRRRAFALLKRARHHDIEVLAIQELATISRVILSGLPWWRLRNAEFNNVLRDTALGNSILYRQKRARVLDFHNLKVPMEGRRRGLNMPVLLLEDRDSGAVYAIVGVHNPSNRPNRRIGVETRTEAKRIQVDYAKRLGVPVIIAGDFNQADLTEFLAAGFTIGQRHGVDAILGRGVTFVGGGVDTSLEGRASDHPLVWAKVRIPVPRGKAPRRLPD